MDREPQKCRYCGEPIFFARSNTTGKMVPIEAAKRMAADVIQCPGQEPIVRRQKVHMIHRCDDRADEMS